MASRDLGEALGKPHPGRGCRRRPYQCLQAAQPTEPGLEAISSLEKRGQVAGFGVLIVPCQSGCRIFLQTS